MRSLLSAIPITLLPLAAQAQPAPSLSTICEKVEGEVARLAPSPENLVVIEVTEELRLAHFDGALSYMGMCGPPHPRVLCVTYELNDYEVGDRVTITGTYSRPGPDYIVLDPCLHYPPLNSRRDPARQHPPLRPNQ